MVDNVSVCGNTAALRLSPDGPMQTDRPGLIPAFRSGKGERKLDSLCVTF